MKKIAWLPDNLNENKILTQLKKACRLAGFENISTQQFYENLDTTDYLILNFYEDINKKFGTYFISFFGKLLRLYKFKNKGIKIIWILNNKLPHEKKSKWSVLMMKILVKKSYKIICLCKESESVLKLLNKNSKNWIKKLIFLQHPNYIGCYDYPLDIKTSSNFTVLFFGAIRPYKNVDVLLKVFKNIPKCCKLKVYGSVKDVKYKNYLESLITDNVELNFGYVSDKKILELIQESTIVVLPYDNETTLNSGSILLTASAKRTFISTNIGTTKDLKEKGLFYTYNYTNENDHIDNLTKIILNCYNEFNNDKDFFVRKGHQLYEYVKTEHSPEKISKILKEEL